MKSWSYLISVIIAIAINKLIKLVIALSRREKISMKVFTRSGDMPSDHGAMVTSVSTVVGLINGFNSAIFAVSFCFAILVLYDAMNLRLSSGEQGVALNKLLAKNRQNRVDVSMGHEPVEVYMGVIVGLLAAFAAFLFF